MSPRHHVSTPIAIAFALAMAWLGSAACDRSASEPLGQKSADAGGIVVDERLVAYLSSARSRHHAATVREEGGDTAGAIRELEALIAAPRPYPPSEAPEIGEVLADTHARLAELRLAAGDDARALETVRAGLALAEKGSFFEGHLLEVEGIVLESRARAFADAGRTAAADDARKSALDRLHRAIEIQEKVIDRYAGDGGRKDGGP